MIFVVVLFIWVIGFPAAYFTRVSGRRGIIGWISVPVVAYFLGSAYLAASWAESSALRLDSPQMEAMVSRLVRDQSFGLGIRGFEDFEEIGRDPVKDSIRCRCQAVSVEGKFDVYFKIEPDPQSWLARRVRLSGVGPLPCGNPEILKMVRQVLTQSGGITELKTLKDFKETSWDRAKNTRMGTGSAVTPQGTFPVLVQVIGMSGDNYGFMVQAKRKNAIVDIDKCVTLLKLVVGWRMRFQA